MVSFFDLALILVLAGFCFYGFFNGLLKMAGNFVGLILGSWLAAHYYLTFYNNTTWLYFGHENLGRIASFVIILILVRLVVGIAFYILQKVFNLISIIPFTKLIDKLAGGAFGLAEGAFFAGTIIYVASRYTLITTFLGAQMTSSKIAPTLIKLVDVLTPLYPEALRILKSIIS
ncbi:MAG: CvpA family protein [Candidatus Falkowbacteria bacterium]